ncbi:hypothetical protein Tco_1536089, partial [Tanacetum coccineum]
MRCPENFLGRYSCMLKDQEDEMFGRIFSDLQGHSLRSRKVFEYILLMKIKLLIKKLEDSEVTAAGYISPAGQRKYSKSLLLLVVKLLLLVLITTARRVSAIRV